MIRTRYLIYLIATKAEWHAFAESVKQGVDLELTAALAVPHDGVAPAGVADAPGGTEVGEHAPEGITRKQTSCREALR